MSISRTTVCGLLAGATAALCVPALPAHASTTAPTTAAAGQPAHATYKVRRGDCLWLIAKRNHTTVAALVKLNKGSHPSVVKNPRLIYAGWVLTVS